MYNTYMANLDDLAEQVSREERIRKAIKIVATKYDLGTKEYLLNIYSDQKIANLYQALRDESSLKTRKQRDDTANHRLIVKYPSQTVYKFLNDVFSPKYGEGWASNKDTLMKVMRDEDLIKPWCIQHI